MVLLVCVFLFEALIVWMTNVFFDLIQVDLDHQSLLLSHHVVHKELTDAKHFAVWITEVHLHLYRRCFCKFT